MPSKSEKCLFPPCVRAGLLWKQASAVALGAALGLFVAPSASAQTIRQVFPAAPYASFEITPGTLGVWFAGDNGPPGTTPMMDVLDGFKYYDFTKTQDSGAYSQADALIFDVEVDSEPPSGKQLLIQVKTGNDLVPIAFAGRGIDTVLTDCKDNSINAPCYPSTYPSGIPTNPSGQGSYRWAARYTGGLIVRVGILFSDICRTAINNTTTNTFCSTTQANFNTNGFTEVPVTFTATQLDTTDTVNVPMPEALTGGFPFKIRLQSYSIPTPVTNLDLSPCDPLSTTRYTPLDSAIKVDTNQLIGTNKSGGPRFSRFIALALLGSGTPPDTDPLDWGSNTILQRQVLGGGQTISGLQNSSFVAPVIDNPYYFMFALRDEAGVLTDFEPTCKLEEVRTAEIQGFLAADKCFIATAAFGSIDVGPVRLLRKFRDKVLLTNTPGRAFVVWYYENSPRWADWLEDHPAFRVPVLSALAPLEAVAWLLLRPMLALALGIAGLALLGSARIRE